MSVFCFDAVMQSDDLLYRDQLLNKLDLAWPPRFIEERLQRTVEAEDGKPTFVRVRLNPVPSLDTLGLLRPKVNRD